MTEIKTDRGAEIHVGRYDTRLDTLIGLDIYNSDGPLTNLTLNEARQFRDALNAALGDDKKAETAKAAVVAYDVSPLERIEAYKAVTTRKTVTPFLDVDKDIEYLLTGQRP